MEKEKDKEKNIDIEDFLYAAFYLPWSYEFKYVNFRKDRLEEYLKDFIERKENMNSEDFIKEGIKFSLTPLTLELIIEKLKRFAKNNEDNEKGRVTNFILHILSIGVPPWDIPFFHGVFVRQVYQHPYSQNRSVFEMIYEYIPKYIEKPDVKLEEKREEKDDIPKGYKRTDSGLIIPE
uniref:Uncharacterized protein n=1 Tax=candidate division WOR-3 bacterium TaxID=2052148 RepID=A0A7C4YFZ1_UNCW3